MKEPIKIRKEQLEIVHGNTKNVEKRKRKEVYAEASKNKFQNVTVKITPEQGDKLDEMIAYIQDNLMCFNCNKRCSAEYFKSNKENELVLSCPHCNNITIDGYSKTKEYVIWFNNILADYGMSYNDGFPKLITTFTTKEMTTRSWFPDRH